MQEQLDALVHFMISLDFTPVKSAMGSNKIKFYNNTPIVNKLVNTSGPVKYIDVIQAQQLYNNAEILVKQITPTMIVRVSGKTSTLVVLHKPLLINATTSKLLKERLTLQWYNESKSYKVQ